MSALQYLNKKSWHTASIRNNEKVWLKEQAAAKEQQRIDELQKQLAEERKIAEIQRLELESGRLDPAQLLKRRRLNWMYEHGPVNTPEEKKKEEEKKRDDVLMGKKKLDVSSEGNETKEKVVMVDMEAKLREDPMFEVELQRVKFSQRDREAVPVRRDSRYTPEEVESKRARKEERRRVREERRLKREERKLRKRQRAIVQQDTSGVSPQAKEDVLGDVPPRRGEKAVETGADSYGLHIPEGGSGVAVTSAFVPRLSYEGRRTSRWDVGPSPESPSKSWSGDGRLERRASGRPPLSPTLRAEAEEKRRLLQEMREDALRLDTERRKRAERHVKEANREREELDDRGRRRKSRLSVSEEEPAVRFARQTIARGASAAERIRQRRAWSADSGSACY